MATLYLVFRVAKFQEQFTEYTDRFLQEQIQYGFQALVSPNPLTVPEFGEIQSIVLLGKGNSATINLYTSVFSFS